LQAEQNAHRGSRIGDVQAHARHRQALFLREAMQKRGRLPEVIRIQPLHAASVPPTTESSADGEDKLGDDLPGALFVTRTFVGCQPAVDPCINHRANRGDGKRMLKPPESGRGRVDDGKRNHEQPGADK